MTGYDAPRDLNRLMKSGTRSGLYRLPGRTSAATLEAEARSAGWQFLHLDLGKVDSKAEFLRATARALHFPEWAGRNWDAFEELVNDLSWLPPAAGYLLLIERSSGFAAADPESLRMALEILRDALAARKGDQPRVIALARGAGQLAAGLDAVSVATSSRGTDS
jgi:hypothetical protein